MTTKPEQQRTKEPKCVAGCKAFTGGEIKHHKDCPFYPDSLSKYYDELQTTLAEWDRLKAIAPPDEWMKAYKEDVSKAEYSYTDAKEVEEGREVLFKSRSMLRRCLNHYSDLVEHEILNDRYRAEAVMMIELIDNTLTPQPNGK